MKKDWKNYLKKFWYFIWEDDSIWSWIVNIIVAFVLIKFVVYPALGLILATSHPVVAVVSTSMEHDSSFNDWWNSQSSFYENIGLSKDEFRKFPLKNGFNKGDIIVLRGKAWSSLSIGDVIVYQSTLRPEPIIHRIIKIYEENGKRFIQTKGDHNSGSNIDEVKISEEQYIGNGLLKIPLLGWVKIGFVGLLKILRIV